jgi:hypothetical protein
MANDMAEKTQPLTAFEAFNADSFCPLAAQLKEIPVPSGEPHEDLSQKKCRFVQEGRCKVVDYLVEKYKEEQEIFNQGE